MEAAGPEIKVSQIGSGERGFNTKVHMVHLPLMIMQRVPHLFLLAVGYLNTLDELWQVQKPEIIYLGRVPMVHLLLQSVSYLFELKLFCQK